MKHLFLIAFAATLSQSVWAAADGAVAGAANAPLTIDEYVDFDCPYCAVGNQTMQKVLENYPGKVKLVSHPIALPSHGEGAISAAKAYNAVYMQNSSLANAFQQELFGHQEQLEKEGDSFLFKAAKKIGANVERMKADMGSPEAEKMLADNQASFDTHGFHGTPSFMIGKETVVGAEPYGEIKKVIDRQL